MATTAKAVPKNTGAMGNIALTQFFIWRRKVLWTYTGAFIAIAIVLMVLVKLMVGWNHTALIDMEPGLMLRSYIIAVLGLLFWAFVRHFPDALGVMVGLGTIKGLPDFKLGEFLKNGTLPNFDRKVVGDAILDTFQKFWKVLDHLMLFFLVLCVVFGTLPIENPSGVIGALVCLAGIGLWSMLFAKVVVWYRRITIGILLVAISVMLYGTYMHFRPQDATIEQVETVLERNEDARQNKIAKLLLEGAKKGTTTAAERELIKSMSAEKKERGLGGVVGVYKDLTYKKQVVYTVRDFQDGAPICGIRNGTRKFSVPSTVVTVGPEKWDVGASIGLNGSLQGNSFEVEGGCVTPGFPTYLTEAKGKNPDQSVTLLITIE
jgi:hypothetical protein